jgi:hypothetical protein
MRRLTYLLLLASLGLPVVLRAQEYPRQSVDTVKQQADILSVLNNSANPRYFVLAKATPVYLQPADTLINRIARRLRGGSKVYIRKFLPTGYLVALPTRDEQYYLPEKSVRRLRVCIEI